MSEENTTEEPNIAEPEEETASEPTEDMTDIYSDPNGDFYEEEEWTSGETETKEEPELDSTPLSLRDCLLMAVLFLIPCVNLIVALVWAFGGSKNINRRNYSRATLIVWAVVFVLYIILVVAILGGTYRAITG